jgi:hypothetical protein
MNARYERDLFDPDHATSTESLRRYLAETGRCRVDLQTTQNRVSMISVVFKRKGHASIRLHEQFLTAPIHIHEALALYLRTEQRDAWQVVSDYARRIIVPEKMQKSPRGMRRRTKGDVYDLKELANAVNARFFNGCLHYHVRWGASRPRTRKRTRSRSIRYGSWSPGTRTVTIHPLLDDERVPRAFISYILYHEMLHAVVPAEASSGRRVDHHALFRKYEDKYPKINDMRRLSRSLLNVLLD